VESGAAIARRWLELSAERVTLHAAELTALDAAIGDGDHGINLQRGFAAIETHLAADPSADAPPAAATLLRLAGTTLVSTVGGASGPLYGTFFIELAAGLDGDGQLMPVPSGNALQAAVAAVARRGRSQRGEKTMLDALGPAADAWQEAAAAGDSLRRCADAAQHAADTGRAATGPLVATKGRASYLGERSRGHIDPGATSATMIIGALADAIAQVGEADGVSR
jgi:phosphoenolpyruvate---glycerone phosphotransferase subunit DhaL